MLKQWQRNLCKLISPSMIARAVHQRLCGGNAGHSHLLTHMTAEAVMYVQMKKQQCVTANSMISYEQSAEQLPRQLPHQTMQPFLRPSWQQVLAPFPMQPLSSCHSSLHTVAGAAQAVKAAAL